MDPQLTQPARRPYTILVVDDDPDQREIAVEILATEGYAVLTASICSYALRLIGKQPIDLLFTDIILPGMSGFELAQQARLVRPSLRVLYATGYARAGQGSGTATFGPTLGKPYRPDELLAAIRSLLPDDGEVKAVRQLA
jgi:CheY-like chemotaxis protein